MFWMLVLDILKIISVPAVIAAVIAVYIANWLGKRQRLYEVKSGVLRELVGRRADFQDPGFKIALNSIPVVFHDNDDIKTAWREYYDVIHYGHLSPEKQAELKKQLKLEGLWGVPRDTALAYLANKKFTSLVLAICESLNIKAKENDVVLVFKEECSDNK